LARIDARTRSGNIAEVSPSSSHAESVRGAITTVLCQLLWGLAPIFWRLLAEVGPVELIAHRSIWTLVFVLGLLGIQGRRDGVLAAFRDRQRLPLNLCSGLLLSSTWLVFVWAVNHGHVVDCSLGYFLVPLVSVAAGRFLLHEAMRRLQWLAVGAAGAGVALMIGQLGRPPWIALALAGCWSGYSLLRKRSSLGSLDGLTVETMLLAPLAAGFLLWQLHTGRSIVGSAGLPLLLLLISTGAVTAIPLLLFAYGARRIRMTTLGLLQYIGPTVNLALGIWLYREPFSRAHAVSFGFIWTGLALYTADNLIAQRRLNPC
jgi:chloramphenicol-sensitive protein RarD